MTAEHSRSARPTGARHSCAEVPSPGTWAPGQQPLGAEDQVQRQAHEQGLHRVIDVLGRDPLRGLGQRVPGLLPHVRQVHRDVKPGEQ
jgi:hypothetical protein